ncbi:sialate O-acetylesterase-like [Mya arenaria]|uniref:sialate O-acetylesterase-like n=1 Tax=Mya arenaria TaxID=6604 RepID=UPI0022E8536F|nr:sialate O-acetylesterase-like [Mya arenaria]
MELTKMLPVVVIVVVGLLDLTAGVPFRVANYYRSHMVLQSAPQRAHVWGYGQPDGIVVFSIDGHFKGSVVVEQDSRWSVLLPAMTSGGPHVLRFHSGNTTAYLSDVMFGDVWICSGQSNMYFKVQQLVNYTDVIARAQNMTGLRIFRVNTFQSNTTLQEPHIATQWHLPRNDTATQQFSAVCLLYALEVAPYINRPIGLVETSWGGTTIEVWSSPDAIAKCHQHQLPHYPQNIRVPIEHNSLWNSMIYPLLPMTIYGALWYQGESNAGYYVDYTCQFPAMINDWREKFHLNSQLQTEKNFPFGFVQLAPNANKTLHTGMPDLRWSQTAGYGYVPNPALPGVFMAVAMDLPDYDSPYGTIHPRDKYDVAKRLGLAGLSVAYGVSGTDYQGPFPTMFTLAGSNMTIEYDEGNDPIRVKSNLGFEVCCGHLQNYTCGYNAFQSAPITGHDATSVTIDTSACHGYNHVVTAVRYAWEMSPCDFKMCAVYDRDSDLPAPCFTKHAPF